MKERKTIYAVLWEDAAFSHRRRLPRALPQLQLTFGIITKTTKSAVNIGTNFRYDRKQKRVGQTRDGFLIPRKAVLSMVPVGYFP